jgi:hypothetical protein
MSATKKRAPVNPRAKQKETVNKKALMWIGVSFVVVVAIMAVLLIVNP